MSPPLPQLYRLVADITQNILNAFRSRPERFRTSELEPAGAQRIRTEGLLLCPFLHSFLPSQMCSKVLGGGGSFWKGHP